MIEKFIGVLRNLSFIVMIISLRVRLIDSCYLIDKVIKDFVVFFFL